MVKALGLCRQAIREYHEGAAGTNCPVELVRLPVHEP
jgi:hypothetical protein